MKKLCCINIISLIIIILIIITFSFIIKDVYDMYIDDNRFISKKHTNVFLEYNDNSDIFFDKSTYGGYIYNDPCKKIKSTTEFRNYVNKHITCLGRWCYNGKYSCPLYNNTECYNVEHIYDLNRGDINGCYNKDISGNLIMAWGRWNQELGKLDYKENMKEKEIIYGKEIIDKARENIIKCGDCLIEENKNIINFIKIISFIILILILLINNLYIIYLSYKNIKINNLEYYRNLTRNNGL